jgi:hypothetical protein
MKDLDDLIAMAYQLSQTLEYMANNELKFGFDLGYQLDQLSYDTLIVANNLREISTMLVGGVA